MDRVRVLSRFRRVVAAAVAIGLGSVAASLPTDAGTRLAAQEPARPVVSSPAPSVPAGRPAGPAVTPARGPAAPALPPLTPAAIEKAAPILAAARQALGGDKLAAVKTLSATGRTRRVRGNNLVPIEFELDIELPDKFLRKDEFPAEEADPTTTGFNGNALLQRPPPATPPARPGGPAVTPAMLEAAQAARVRTIKQDFVRLTLGLFASSFDAYPLTFGYAALAQAPQGTADVLDVRGGDGFALRFFVDSATHLPIMVSWTLPSTPASVLITVPGQPLPASIAPGTVVITGPAAPAATASDQERDAYAQAVRALQEKALATPVEHRLYFADYRPVDGVTLPFRLRRAIGADTTEETTFDRYRINPRIAPDTFTLDK